MRNTISILSFLTVGIMLTAPAHAAPEAKLAEEPASFRTPPVPIAAPDEAEFTGAVAIDPTTARQIQSFRNAGVAMAINPETGWHVVGAPSRGFAVELGVPTLQRVSLNTGFSRSSAMQPADAFDWIDGMLGSRKSNFRMRSLVNTGNRHYAHSSYAYGGSNVFEHRQASFGHRSSFRSSLQVNAGRHNERHVDAAAVDNMYAGNDLTGVAGSLNEIMQVVSDGLRYALSLVRGADQREPYGSARP